MVYKDGKGERDHPSWWRLGDETRKNGLFGHATRHFCPAERMLALGIAEQQHLLTCISADHSRCLDMAPCLWLYTISILNVLFNKDYCAMIYLVILFFTWAGFIEAVSISFGITTSPRSLSDLSRYTPSGSIWCVCTLVEAGTGDGSGYLHVLEHLCMEFPLRNYFAHLSLEAYLDSHN